MQYLVNLMINTFLNNLYCTIILSLPGNTCSLFRLTNLHVADYFSIYNPLFFHIILIINRYISVSNIIENTRPLQALFTNNSGLFKVRLNNIRLMLIIMIIIIIRILIINN